MNAKITEKLLVFIYHISKTVGDNKGHGQVSTYTVT